MLLVNGPHLAQVDLAPDLGPLLLVHLALGDVLLERRRVGSRRYLIGVVGIQAGVDPLFLCEPGELVLVKARGGAAVLAAAFACFAMGWVGGGDAKVAAGAALWFGFGHLLNYLVYASLFGGVLTLLLLEFRQWPLPYALSGQAWLLRLHAKETGIPYGIALAIGALMIYPETEWIRAVDLTHFVAR